MGMSNSPIYFNQKLYGALRNRVANYDETVGIRVVNAVHSALVDGLGAEDDEVLPDAGLVSALSAESIGGLDLAYRIETELGIRFSRDKGSLPIAMLLRNPEAAETPKELVDKTVLELAEEAYNLACGAKRSSRGRMD